MKISTCDRLRHIKSIKMWNVPSNVIIVLLLCQIINTNSFSISNRLSTNHYCLNNIYPYHLQRINSHLSSKKVDEEWIEFLKQQTKNNDTGKLSIRDRMKKWLSFKKNIDNEVPSSTTSPMVQPIQLYPEEEEESVDKMKSLRAEQRQQRQERIQEKIESSWSLDAVVKDEVTGSKYLDDLLTDMPSMEQIFEDKPDTDTKDIKNEFLKKQEMIRKMVTESKSNKDVVEDTRSSASIREELNTKAYDAVKQLRDKRKSYPLKEPSEYNPELISTWVEPQQNDMEFNEDDPMDEVYQRDDGRVLEIATKQVPISKQMYRSIVSKQNSTNMYQQYDSFLQKEQFMRQQMQSINTSTILTPEELKMKKRQIQDMKTRKQYESFSNKNVDSSMIKYLNQKRKYEQQANMQQELNEVPEEYLHLDHDKDLHRDGDDYKGEINKDHMDELENWMKHKQISFDNDDTLPNTPFFQEQNDDSSTYSRISSNELEDIFTTKDSNFFEDSYLNKGIDNSQYYNARKQDLLTQTEELTVEQVNALMEYNYTSYRLLSINKPDSSYGAIFKLDGLIIDFTDIYYNIWLQLYNQTFGNNDDYRKPLRPPTREEVSIAQTYPPQEVISNIFFWTNDYFEAKQIADDFLSILQTYFCATKENNNYSYPLNYNYNKLVNNIHVNDGIYDWLDELNNVDMPCSIISNLKDDQLDIVLNQTNLSQYFPHDVRVTSIPSSFYDPISKTESQQMLNAAIRLNRRPDHCIVFDTTPSSAIAAHDVEMRHVAMMGLYPMYELNTADCIIDEWEEMTVMGVRRLFSDRDYDKEREQPAVQLEVETPLVKPSTRFRRWAEGDRD